MSFLRVTYDAARACSARKRPAKYGREKIDWRQKFFQTTMTYVFDNQGVTHHLPCSKGGQQGDGLETIRFAVTVHPSIGRVCEQHIDYKVVGICDNIFIIARLFKALSCAAEMKKILKADLDMDLNAPNSMFSFRILPLVSAQLDLLSKVQ